MAFPHSKNLSIIAAALLLALSTPLLRAASAARQPVLVELFTSEGCSDCPPADELLAQLDRQQFVPGADAIVLSEHVTYWNHLGWRDPFSFDQMDRRQQQYAHAFALSTVYTPQIVVDGAQQLVGSDAAKLRAAIAAEAAQPKLDVAIRNPRLAADGDVSFSVQLGPGVTGTLVAAVAQDAVVSRVSRGENAGRTLHHVAVVRAMTTFSAQSAIEGHPLQIAGTNLAAAEKSGAPLRLVVFLTDSFTGKVKGAAQQLLRP